jgi:predicted DNA-binding protein with PD1-like motif
MKAVEGSLGRVFVLRLEDGDLIPDCIERFAEEKRITGGFCALLGGIGDGKIVAGPEDGSARPVEPIIHRITDVHEAAAVGMIFPDEDGIPRLHMHAALGRAGRTSTGCTRTGLTVWQIVEAVIIEITGTGLERKLDPVTGFSMLSAD